MIFLGRFSLGRKTRSVLAILLSQSAKSLVSLNFVLIAIPTNAIKAPKTKIPRQFALNVKHLEHKISRKYSLINTLISYALISILGGGVISLIAYYVIEIILIDRFFQLILLSQFQRLWRQNQAQRYPSSKNRVFMFTTALLWLGLRCQCLQLIILRQINCWCNIGYTSTQEISIA